MGVRAPGEWVLRCDGGSRGNPGPAAFGFVLHDPEGREALAHGEFIGEATNNVAEYRALIAGLVAAAEHGVVALSVVMDSELVIRKMTGEYRVRHAGLKLLHEQARRAVSRVRQVRFAAVRRDRNARADELVNAALDRELGPESPR